MPFEGISDPSLHPLIINPHFKARDALGADMVFDDASFLLVPLRENGESEKLVVKASCGLDHDLIGVSKNIFVYEEYLIKENHLDEPWVEVTHSHMELVDVVLIEFPPKHILTSIVLPLYSPLSHSFMEPLMSTSPKSKTCIIYAPNLDLMHSKPPVNRWLHPHPHESPSQVSFVKMVTA